MTSSIAIAPDTSADLDAALAEKIRILSSLLRLHEEQERAERLAYSRGWADCGNALSYASADAWEAGYDTGYAEAYREVDARWAEVAKRAHFLGSPESRTFDQLEALRNGADWADVRDWPVTGGRGVTA